MSQPLAAIRNVSINLSGRQILDGVSGDILRNRITALIGLNGSGKSTLLKALVGEIPFRGEIKYFCGHDHSKPQPDHVGYVPQKLSIDGRMPITVREFFALALQRRPIFLGVSKKVTAAAERLLGLVGAKHLLNRPLAKLSGGELQRVLLSLALEPNPELLLLDEPAAGIDFADQQPFYDLLADINKKHGVTILLVSHDLSIVSEHAHHVLCLQGGKIVCQGPPTEIITPQLLSDTFGQGKRLYDHTHSHGHDDGESCDHHSHGH